MFHVEKDVQLHYIIIIFSDLNETRLQGMQGLLFLLLQLLPLNAQLLLLEERRPHIVRWYWNTVALQCAGPTA